MGNERRYPVRVRVRGGAGPCSHCMILLESDKSVGGLNRDFPRIRGSLSFSVHIHFCTCHVEKVATQTIRGLREKTAVWTTPFSLSDGLSFPHGAYASRCPSESAFQYHETGVSVLNTRHKRPTEWRARRSDRTGGPIFSCGGRGGGCGAYRNLHYAAAMVSGSDFRGYSPSTPIRGVAA